MPKIQRGVLIAAIVLALGYAWLRGAFISLDAAAAPEPALPASARVATFAAGCFWSAESAFEGVAGVLAVVSGYTGGTIPNPTYRQVSAGATGHTEAVEVAFDPTHVSYGELLDRFWHQVDLFTAHRQFCDLGDQYRPAVFVHGPEQRRAVELSRKYWEAHFGQPIRVEIADASAFYRAEDYHQHFAARHPIQYGFYRWSCGRDTRLAQIWR